MRRSLLITGTDTEVGKTFVTRLLARMLRRQGIDVGVMKPVACGAVERGGRLVSEDALLLKVAAGVEDDLNLINPILFRPPLAPVPAAALEGERVDLATVETAFAELTQRHETVLVEGIGGILVPLVRGVTVADLAVRLNLPVLIVARPNLGTVNHTLLTIEAARSRGLEVVGVVFTASSALPPGDAERTGPREIAEESGVKNLGELPHLEVAEDSRLDDIAEACAPRLRLDTILRAMCIRRPE